MPLAIPSVQPSCLILAPVSQDVGQHKINARLTMKDKHSGSCLCGAISFEIFGHFESFYLCHCEHCRKDTGSAHSANLFSGTARLDWISGEEHVRTFNLPATRHTRSFCETCGSAVPSLQKAGRLLVVPAGCLETDLDIKPTAHIFHSSKANWDTGFGDIAIFEKFPV